MIDLNLMDAALWWAVGGSVAVAITLDVLALLDFTARCWAMLIERS
jgi:hypothetical protein